jgi:hypothetical protein
MKGTRSSRDWVEFALDLKGVEEIGGSLMKFRGLIREEA